MATVTAKTDDQETAAPETSDSPVLDLLDAAVMRLIKVAKARGYVTYDELNEVLPPDEVSPDQIEDIMTMFSDLGVNVVDAEEVEEAAAAEPIDDDEEEDQQPAASHLPVKQERSTEVSERTGDPVRIDLEKGTADILISPSELAERRAALQKHGGYKYPASQTPWQEIQRSMVEQLADGMVLRPAVKYQNIAHTMGIPRDNH